MRFLLAGVLAASLALTSCSSDKDDAEQAVERLARALESGQLPPSIFEGEGAAVQAAFEEIVGDLAEPRATRTVRRGPVTVQDDEAKATLSWSWDVDGHAWAYETTATLTKAADAWVTTWAPQLVEPTLEDGDTLDVRELAPDRGDILGARGVPLVTERPVVRYGVDKTPVGAAKAAASARRVARLLDVDVKPYVEAVRKAGDKAFVEALVLRTADARAVDPAYADIPGALALDDRLPLAPTRDFAAAILGRVGPVTAELVEESGGRLEAGDITGLSGLQARYDEQLTGASGVEVAAFTEDGTGRVLFAAEPEPGKPLRTTLDPALQGKAERVLAEVEHAAAIVALRPSDGAILAAANGPGTGGLNAATFGQYAPGSTFKIVTSLALLRSGMTADSPLQCPEGVVVDGKRFENYDDYPPGMLGRITLRQAVAHSCNTAFIGARGRLGENALAEAAESLGLGQDFDLGFPAYFGQVPLPQSETEAAADLIGQGTVLASPMVMAAVTASVPAGRTVVPHLLVDLAPAAEPDAPLTKGEAAALRELMGAVVAEGSGRFLAGTGAEGAKTGTAEYGEPRGDGSLATHAWMVTYRGDLAVAVFVETGESGSGTAGPLIERFLAR